MELKLFLKLLQKNIRMIVVAGIIGSVFVAAITLQLNENYIAKHSIYVQKSPEKPASGDFTYDGYYAQQAAELYTDTVVGLFESPGISARALELTEKNNTADDVEKFQKRVEVEKVAPRLIDVHVESVDEDNASELVTALFTAVHERVETLTSQGDNTFAMQINVVTASPLVSTEEPMVILYTIVGLLGGLFVSISGIMLREYLLSD